MMSMVAMAIVSLSKTIKINNALAINLQAATAAYESLMIMFFQKPVNKV